MSAPAASALFVDCRPDIAPRLTDAHRAIVPGLEINFGSPEEPEELIALIRPHRAIMAYMSYLSAEVFAACPRLEVVSYLSTGLATRLDLAAAERHGVTVRGVKGYGDRAVAEHTIALVFAAARRLVAADARVRGRGWGLMESPELGGRTLGILGTGAIGAEVARLAKALGMRVIAWNRSGVPGGLPAESVTLERLFDEADVVSLHLALSDETRGLVGKGLLGRLKPGAILVNTARAQLVEEAALLAALTEGPLAHAALDVFHLEPPPADSPLLGLDNVTLSPHSAWFTPEAVERLLTLGLEALRDALAGLAAAPGQPSSGSR